jgi:hypothetical protein
MSSPRFIFLMWGGKLKVPRTRPEGPEGCTGIALLFPDLGARRAWVVSTTPRPLYPRERRCGVVPVKIKG